MLLTCRTNRSYTVTRLNVIAHMKGTHGKTSRPKVNSSRIRCLRSAAYAKPFDPDRHRMRPKQRFALNAPQSRNAATSSPGYASWTECLLPSSTRLTFLSNHTVDHRRCLSYYTKWVDGRVLELCLSGKVLWGYGGFG